MAKKHTEAKRQDKTAEGEVAGPPPKVLVGNVKRYVDAVEGYASLYANDVQVQTTPWDIRLVIGQIMSVPSRDDPTMEVRQIGDVRMSPQLAKRLVMILASQIQHYEKTVGPIPLSDSSAG